MVLLVLYEEPLEINVGCASTPSALLILKTGSAVLFGSVTVRVGKVKYPEPGSHIFTDPTDVPSITILPKALAPVKILLMLALAVPLPSTTAIHRPLLLVTVLSPMVTSGFPNATDPHDSKVARVLEVQTIPS